MGVLWVGGVSIQPADLHTQILMPCLYRNDFENPDQRGTPLKEKTGTPTFALNPEFRLFYSLYNGQDLGSHLEDITPLFGRILVYDHLIMTFLLPIGTI